MSDDFYEFQRQVNQLEFWLYIIGLGLIVAVLMTITFLHLHL